MHVIRDCVFCWVLFVGWLHPFVCSAFRLATSGSGLSEIGPNPLSRCACKCLPFCSTPRMALIEAMRTALTAQTTMTTTNSSSNKNHEQQQQQKQEPTAWNTHPTRVTSIAYDLYPTQTARNTAPGFWKKILTRHPLTYPCTILHPLCQRW